MNGELSYPDTPRSPVVAGKYLVGIDMQAGEVHKKLEAIQISGGLSLLGSILLAIGFSRFLSAKYLPSIQELAARCRAIAGGKAE